MATAMQRTRPCLSLFFRKLQQRFNSTAINFCNTREESVKHCSGLREKFQFNSEYRGLVIQQSIEHLKTLENFKIKDEVEQIFINDQYQSKGLDEKRYFYCILIVFSVFLWIVIFFIVFWQCVEWTNLSIKLTLMQLTTSYHSVPPLTEVGRRQELNTEPCNKL